MGQVRDPERPCGFMDQSLQKGVVFDGFHPGQAGLGPLSALLVWLWL